MFLIQVRVVQRIIPRDQINNYYEDLLMRRQEGDNPNSDSFDSDSLPGQTGSLATATAAPTTTNGRSTTRLPPAKPLPRIFIPNLNNWHPNFRFYGPSISLISKIKLLTPRGPVPGQPSINLDQFNNNNDDVNKYNYDLETSGPTATNSRNSDSRNSFVEPKEIFKFEPHEAQVKPQKFDIIRSDVGTNDQTNDGQEDKRKNLNQNQNQNQNNKQWNNEDRFNVDRNKFVNVNSNGQNHNINPYSNVNQNVNQKNQKFHAQNNFNTRNQNLNTHNFNAQQNNLFNSSSSLLSSSSLPSTNLNSNLNNFQTTSSSRRSPLTTLTSSRNKLRKNNVVSSGDGTTLNYGTTTFGLTTETSLFKDNSFNNNNNNNNNNDQNSGKSIITNKLITIFF